MIVAPIQLHQLSFRRVAVEIDEGYLAKGEFGQADKHFDFEGVVIVTHVGFSPLDQEARSLEKNFLLTLRVVVNNEAPDDGSESKPSPYLVDIEAGGIIGVAKGAEKLGDIEKIVLVNGTSMLWSAIREQVSNLTARMPLGIATLPTVHFQDLRRQRVEDGAALTKKRKPRVTKPRSKTTP